MKLVGLFTAMVTPFDEFQRINEEGLRQNIRFQIENGVDGIVVLGTTGEAPTLSWQEQECIIKIAVEECRGQIPVIVGTGSYATATTIKNTRQAKDLGADGALIVAPYYNKPTQEGLYLHFKSIAEALPGFPIILYNIPGRTGQNMQVSTMQRLLEFPSIMGIKEATGNVNHMIEVMDCVRKHRPDFKVLSGDDNLTLPLISIGGHGIISVASNLIPKEVKLLVDTALQGDFTLARELHYQLLPLFRGAFIETNPIPIKAAMNFCGMPSGPCRLPLCDLMPENNTAMRKILDEMSLFEKALVS